MIVINSATIVSRQGLLRADVVIDDGVITQVGEVDAGNPEIVFDGRGLVLGPGFVDLHVHLRDPGQTWKEDVASGSRAAAAGGFTSIVAMPNTDPAIDSAKVSKFVIDEAQRSAPIQITVAGALTKARNGIEMSDLAGLYESGVRIFTDDGDSVADAGLLRRIMMYLSDLPGAVVAQHAEDASIAGDGHVHEGLVSQTLGIKGLPASAEETVIARDLILAAETGVHYHAQHLSTARSVELVRSAKLAGVRVSAEVTPHHLTMTDEACLELDTNTKMYPPLRTADDVAALRHGLVSGVIDVVATDHAPHTRSEKEVPFEEAPRGILGLETAFPLVLAALDGDIMALFHRMSLAPAAIGSLPNQGNLIEVGAPANLVLVDPSSLWKVHGFESKSSNSPFVGNEMTGQVVATISNGEIVHRRAK